MKKVRVFDRDFECLIPQQQLEAAIANVAETLNLDYRSSDAPPVLLITLNGAMMFASQLAKSLTFDALWAFVKCSSYENTMCSNDTVCLQIEPTIDLAGREVIVLEDVVDTGNTWIFLHSYLLGLGVKSIKIASMVVKRSVYKHSLPIDYAAIETAENKFIIGYGLDYAQHGRNLPAIYKLVE